MSFPFLVGITTTPSDDSVSVGLVWAGVDRATTSGGWAVADQKTADRLVAAIEAGAVLRDVEVRTDVNGKTYMNYRSTVLGRTMKADLTRLGF